MNKITMFILFLTISAMVFPAEFKGYEVKSGCFEMKTQSQMGNSTTLHYFDDYGKKSRTEVKSNINNQNGMAFNTNMIVILNQDKSYTLFPESKTYMADIEDEVEEDEDDSADTDNLKNEKPSRTEDFMGKSCEVYEIDDDETKMTMWMWKGMILKQVVVPKSRPDMKTISEVTKLDFSSVDSDLFELPAGYTEKKLGFGDMFKNMDKAMAEQKRQAEEEEQRAQEEEQKAREDEARSEEDENDSDDEEKEDEGKKDDDDIDKALDIMKSFF